jgi:hypothetical protein
MRGAAVESWPVSQRGTRNSVAARVSQRVRDRDLLKLQEHHAAASEGGTRVPRTGRIGTRVPLIRHRQPAPRLSY